MHKRMSPHGDYTNREVINLVENFKVKNVILNCGVYNELEQELIKLLNKKRIPYYGMIIQMIMF